MAFLIDTHIVIWLATGNPRLGADRILTLESEEILISAASIWEISIKQAIGKLDVPSAFLDDVEDLDAEVLPISAIHARAAGQLPLHHADPFDRMLIAQARAERLKLMTDDRRIAKYDVEVV